MTLQDLIRILIGYERAYGNRYVCLATDTEIIGDAKSVGIDDETGDVVISILD